MATEPPAPPASVVTPPPADIGSGAQPGATKPTPDKPPVWWQSQPYLALLPLDPFTLKVGGAILGAGALILILWAAILSGSGSPTPSTATSASATAPEARPVFNEVAFEDLPGWETDRVIEAMPALERSCARFRGLPAEQPVGPDGIGGTAGLWAGLCERMPGQRAGERAARAWLMQEFVPWQVTTEEREDGLFTGYYVPILKASRSRSVAFATPIHGMPPDLVRVDLSRFHEDLKGRSATGRLVPGEHGLTLEPYPERAAIVAGDLPAATPVIAWVSDPVDAFVLQIQGSGILEFEDGKRIRVGYAGQNGRRYVPIGRVMVEEGRLTREQATMPGIRKFLEQNKGAIPDWLNRNPSYVFFYEQPPQDVAALGAEGVPLAANRSLAVDRSLWPYGMPVWVATEHPLTEAPFERLMIAQDTGGAIRGAVRGDIFFGEGVEAEEAAGTMRGRGRWWVLLPKGVEPG